LSYPLETPEGIIDKYGFIENVGYVVFNKFGENPNGGRPLI
jgi:hypothetical protein